MHSQLLFVSAIPIYKLNNVETENNVAAPFHSCLSVIKARKNN